MTGADDDIITLSVPVGVASLYLVPTSAPPADPREAAVAVLATLSGQVRHTAELMLDDDWLTVELVPAQDDPILLRALKMFDATPDQLAMITTATHLIRVRGIGKAWWQPYHEYAARAVAAGLAAQLGADLIDLFTPRVLTVAQALRSLPPDDGGAPLADWVTVLHWRDEGGSWSTTRGLRRYGLPELRTIGVPTDLVGAWTDAVLGVAARLLDEWEAALLAEDRPSFVELPAEFTVQERDVARAQNRLPSRDASVRIRLRLDLPDDPDGETLLTIVAPRDVPPPVDNLGVADRSAAFIAATCAVLFG